MTELLREKFKHAISKNMHVNYTITRNPIIIQSYKRKNRPKYPKKITNYIRINDVDKHFQYIPMKNQTIIKTGYKILKKLQKTLKSIKKDKEHEVEIRQTDFFTKEYDEFWGKIAQEIKLAAIRKQETLNWRYMDPRNGHHTVLTARKNDKITGYTVIRINKNRPEYPVGFINDLITLPHDNETAIQLVNEAIKHLDKQNINTTLSLGIQGHPHNQALLMNGFIDSTYPLLVYLLGLDRELDVNQLGQIKSSEMIFHYGDIDSLPTSI